MSNTLSEIPYRMRTNSGQNMAPLIEEENLDECGKPMKAATIKTLVKDITTLSINLPLSIRHGTKDDKIWSVMNSDERDTAHETFNRRFDAMFGEDCRDSAGRLQYIRRGKHGLGMVVSYLSKLDWEDGFPLDIVEIKLQRLIAELRHLWRVSSATEADSPFQTRPSRQAAPTAKLTDANNAVQAELSFQRKAVQEFCTHSAQETTPVLNPSSSIDTEDPTTLTAPLKCNLSALIDVGAINLESDGDEDIDGQSKPSKKKRTVTPKTTNVSKNKHTTVINEDTDGGNKADREPDRTTCTYIGCQEDMRIPRKPNGC
ncbi:hypothetical protein JOM56_008229 [Amanita muscaria]